VIARKQSTTTYPVQFLMVDSTDHVTAETGLSPTVTISKNGAAYGAASGAVTEVGNGVYAYAGNALDRDTLGELMIHAEATGADKVDMKVLITSYDPFVDIASILADTGTDGVIVASGTVTTLTNLPAAPTDWLTGAAVKADAVTKLQANLALEATLTAIKGAGWDTQTLTQIHDDIVNGFDGESLSQITGDWTDGGRLDLLIDAIKAKTDTIVALTAQTVWEYATRVLTAGTNIDLSALATATDLATVDTVVDAIKAKTDNLPADPADDSDIDSQLAAIKAVVDNVHDTDLPAVKAETASILEDTGTTLDGIVDAIKVKTDQLTFTTAAKVDATATVDSSAFSTIAGNVWSHPIRTLTNQGIEATTPASGDPLEVYRDTTISFTLTGLAGMTGYTKIWFTVKEDLEDLDTAAVLQIATTDGLKYLDGSATVTDDDGTLEPDVNAGTAVIKLQQASAALLPVYAAYPIPWDLKMLNAGIVSRLAEGTMYIKSTPTRSIS
jgi:hypothetical protein